MMDRNSHMVCEVEKKNLYLARLREFLSAGWCSDRL
jgi:hypothetical protein